ncbi:MAG TPA: hypothetical protein VK472_07640 [Allosphingosinicella sp.]|nr:hypothetical protein [Allosphingosinicella sp.]
MRDGWIWDRLGIAPTADEAGIRRAYAARLKAIDPDSDSDAFIALREALEAALDLAGGGHGDSQDLRFDDAWMEPVFEPHAPGPAPEDLAPLNSEILERIDAFLFSEAGPEDPGELERLTRAILDQPAAQHIETARWLEAWISDRIVQAMPRSDPMIEPAVAHFRWGEGSELSRPPEIDYILQRRDDQFFEIDLATNARGYARLLDDLRRPRTRVGALRSWWRAPRVEYLLGYLQTYRPTVLRGLDEENVEHWSDRIEAGQRSGGLRHWLRERRRGLVWNRGLYGAEGASGNDMSALGGFGWLGAMALVMLFRLIDWNSAPSPPQPVYVAPNARIYSEPAADLNPLIARATLGQGDLSQLETTNPRLHAQLVDRWRQARGDGEERRWFEQGVEDLLDKGYLDAIRSGGFELESDHWRLFADQLKWARRTSPTLCGSYLRGDSESLPFSAELSMRASTLLARALLEPAGRPRDKSPPGSTFSIPGPIAKSTAARAHLEEKALSAALLDRGTPARRCDARIALIEAALDQPKSVAAPFLRRMSASL